MGSQVVLIVVALALVGANAFFVATEFALVKVRLTRLDEMAEAGSRAAARTRDMARHIDQYLSACQLGITLASLALGWIGEPAFAGLVGRALGAVGLDGHGWVQGFEVTVAFVALTMLHIVLGELAPKSIAIQYTEQVALSVSWPMLVFFRASAPAIHMLNWLGNAAVRMLGLPPADQSGEGHSPAELRRMLHESHRAGTLGLTERQLLDNAFAFAGRTVRQVMRPRGECAYISLAEPLERTLDRVRKTGYTRYPLCRSDMDEVLGLVHVKDLLFPAKPLETAADLLALRREILFVPEMVGVSGLLAQMRRAKTMMAVCVDEYGVISGLCTMEDILEELVGEIQDEHDQEHPLIRPASGGGFLVEGKVLLGELSKRLMLDVKLAGAETISGYVMAQIGRMPREGDTLTIQNFRVTVIEVDALRLARLLFTPIAPEGAGCSSSRGSPSSR